VACQLIWLSSGSWVVRVMLLKFGIKQFFSLKRGSTLKNITDELKNQPEKQVGL
jgi:hypothetical protein